MKKSTRNLLFEAWAYCDKHDKSTEFMLQYMADSAGVSYDTAVDFVTRTTDKERSDWYKSHKK